MKHVETERAAHSPGRASAEIPALLVAGGSRSSRCRVSDVLQVDDSLLCVLPHRRMEFFALPLTHRRPATPSGFRQSHRGTGN
jgi:hypothetical protein